MSDEKPQTIYRRDYVAPDYWVETVDLHFELARIDLKYRRARTAGQFDQFGFHLLLHMKISGIPS